MSIRVIAGSAKGRQLKLVPGDVTRPIMDRVKEALFNIIGRRIYDAQFYDMFAGTGSVGIEALSRGAEHALFTDMDAGAIATINANLKLTKLAERASVRKTNALTLLAQPPSQLYDFIYIAPPQYQGLWLDALRALDQNPGWLQADGQAIVQIDPTENAPYELQHFALDDERRYGNTTLLFFNVKSLHGEEQDRG